MDDSSSGGGGGSGFPGHLGIPASGSDFNRHGFQISQELGRVRTHVPVKIIAVHGGGVGPAPTVDVQVLVKQIDGLMNAASHVTIYGIPTTRSQGGDSVIINDPVVGDVGSMAIHDRDISAVKANGGAESPPGSFRRFDLSDGVYHGPMLNQTTPKQYIQFLRDSNGKGNGIKTVDAFNNTITSTAAGVVINGVTIDQQGNIKAPGNVTAGQGTGDQVDLQHHTHGGGPQPDPGS